MDGEETCIKKLVEVAHQEDAVFRGPGSLPYFLKPAWAILRTTTVIIIILLVDIGVEVIVLLRNDIAGLEGRANRRTDTP